jgi:hypothetical protein
VREASELEGFPGDGPSVIGCPICLDRSLLDIHSGLCVECNDDLHLRAWWTMGRKVVEANERELRERTP